MKCKCKYYLMGEDGVRRCVQCKKPAPSKIEDKLVEKHETKEA